MKRARIGLDLFVTLVVCFPALGTGCMFSRAWHRFLFFPRLSLVTCSFRAWRRLHVFPRSVPVTFFFSARGTGRVFLCQVLIGSLRLLPLFCFGFTTSELKTALSIRISVNTLLSLQAHR